MCFAGSFRLMRYGDTETLFHHFYTDLLAYEWNYFSTFWFVAIRIRFFSQVKYVVQAIAIDKKNTSRENKFLVPLLILMRMRILDKLLIRIFCERFDSDECNNFTLREFRCRAIIMGNLYIFELLHRSSSSKEHCIYLMCSYTHVPSEQTCSSFAKIRF